MALRDPDKTRAKLLDVASMIFHQKGYNGTSLSDILNEAQVSKGALYHHFSNKQELLYAVVDELYRSHFLSRWQDILTSQEPIVAIAHVVDAMGHEGSDEEMCSGCPLHNISAELAANDEGLRLRVDAIFKELQNIIEQGFERAKSLGQCADSVDTHRVALLFMCSLNGVPQMVKSCQERKVFLDVTAALADYVRSFKVA